MVCGIWFEPYQFKETEKFFGPYAYKDDGKIALTMEYSNEEYNYFIYDWYLDGINANKDTAWSDPYYDETSDITMITTSTSFAYESGEIAGVISADIDLNSVQKLINETKVGKSGWAFLLNEEGLYIADNNIDNVMKENITMIANDSLANAGNKIITTQKGNVEYTDNNNKYNIYYAQIPQTNWIIGLTIPQKELYSSLNTLLRNITIAFLLSLLLVIVGILLYTNNLTSKMTDLKEIAEQLAKGNFSVFSEIRTEDELGALSKSFNTLIQGTKALLSNTVNVSNEVSSVSANLAATSQETAANSNDIARVVEEIARGASEQAVDAEKAAVIVNSLDEKFKILKDNSNNMFESANEANIANETGITAVKVLVDKTELNNSSMTRVENAIDDLSAKSNNIVAILETISNIAKQTNLLALNASIEAARAGEAGKGFAVVAEEIRKLAEGSEEAAHNINEIVADLQRGSSNTVSIMDEVKILSQAQTEAVNSVNYTFVTIYEAIENITSEISSINDYIDIMNEDKDKILVSIGNISSVSQETAASSEEVAASMEQQTLAVEEVTKNTELLNELAANLDKQINRFKII